MKNTYKPVLFSTEMVKAILEGRKTQTRRTQGLVIPNQNPDGYEFLGWDKNLVVFKSSFGKFVDCKPKFNKGDILWVRETFGYDHHQEDLSKVIVYKADNAETTLRTETETELPSGEIITKNRSFWHPSIHMPKSAARLFLEVTNVRCERLQDISEEDAIAEGVLRIQDWHNEGKNNYFWKDYGYRGRTVVFISAVDSFQSLWQSINGKDSWEANPWVWVYEYKKIEKPAVWPI